jgi:hypothetical protein
MPNSWAIKTRWHDEQNGIEGQSGVFSFEFILIKIFQELGGTFGKHMVRVKIKDLEDQFIIHKFSEEMAGQIGWLTSYIWYSDDKPNTPFITVTFDDLQRINVHGDTTYKSLPIALGNLYPIGYGDEPIDFAKHAAKREMERKEFLDRLGFKDEMF